jgi:hypothetical protein
MGGSARGKRDILEGRLRYELSSSGRILLILDEGGVVMDSLGSAVIGVADSYVEYSIPAPKKSAFLDRIECSFENDLYIPTVFSF